MRFIHTLCQKGANIMSLGIIVVTLTLLKLVKYFHKKHCLLDSEHLAVILVVLCFIIDSILWLRMKYALPHLLLAIVSHVHLSVRLLWFTSYTTE